jgi:DHA1 family bicyclomycin/chloramphenicol resistance-like MFS transporter
MVAQFHTPASAIQLTLTTFIVGPAAGQLVIGALSDRFGRRPLMLAGTVVCIVASGACALAPNILLLTVFCFLHGFGSAAGVVLSWAEVAVRARGAAAARVFSPHDRQRRCTGGCAAVGGSLIG